MHHIVALTIESEKILFFSLDAHVSLNRNKIYTSVFCHTNFLKATIDSFPVFLFGIDYLQYQFFNLTFFSTPRFNLLEIVLCATNLQNTHLTMCEFINNQYNSAMKIIESKLFYEYQASSRSTGSNPTN